ncbi:MarR family transcriptional regulator [Natronococcus sp. A-GB7]|uniref:helix-turn-helix transcriptional regulator n=1 Tax=Natronococcus sp. A-GB7 TaxID=3037649 RepID=UPI00241DEE44|nr:MarR family transcriptional regulator [Natronococcus sp. A-GB7]MDG5818035.1 MarR family transcriptional regulator [Natronococcus sp. A-GB7]
MDRTTRDAAVAALIAGILLLGVGATWQAYRQAQAHGEMMGHAAVHGPNPGWYLLGSILAASVVGGAYWIVREERTAKPDQQSAPRGTEAQVEAGPSTAADESPPESRDTPGDRTDEPAARTSPHVLAVLPEDERRVLEPVVDSPGITQIALRDRAEFSKSKVSQTVTDLEKRGLLYRERQGRTYRVYPSDELTDDLDGGR